MSGCTYCDDNQNPFEYGYAPLWFAWHPAITTDGNFVFLKKVHKRSVVGGSGNFAGDYPAIWSEYPLCKRISREDR